jgi:very-short-patch-repair endonuclease
MIIRWFMTSIRLCYFSKRILKQRRDTTSIEKPLGLPRKVRPAFSILPNPASDCIELTRLNKEIHGKQDRIFDMTGNILMEDNLKDTHLDISWLHTGIYILDFYCQEEKLAIELDGQDHFTLSGSIKDEDRTRFLNQKGIRVIRFENVDVFEYMDFVLEEIGRHFRGRIGMRG